MRRRQRMLWLVATFCVATSGACGDDAATEAAAPSTTGTEPTTTTPVTLVYGVAEGIELHVYVDGDDFSSIRRPGAIWHALVDGEAFSCGVDWEGCLPTDETLAQAMVDQGEGFTQPLASEFVASDVGEPLDQPTTAGTIAGEAVTCTAMERGEVCVLDVFGYLARLSISEGQGPGFGTMELLRVEVGTNPDALPPPS